MFYVNSLSIINLYIMDTTTVLEIIKMIDNRLENMLAPYVNIDEMSPMEFGAQNELRLFGDHLQSFIEAELNKAEQ